MTCHSGVGKLPQPWLAVGASNMIKYYSNLVNMPTIALFNHTIVGYSVLYCIYYRDLAFLNSLLMNATAKKCSINW